MALPQRSLQIKALIINQQRLKHVLSILNIQKHLLTYLRQLTTFKKV